MKKIKILSIALIILAMCITLGVTSWAADTSSEVAFTATLNTDSLCVNEQEEVTVTIAASKEIEIFSFDAKIIVPEGWSIKSVTNETLGLVKDENYVDGHIVWYNQLDNVDNVATTELVTITYAVPKDAKGDFTLGLTELQLGKLVSPSYEVIEKDAVTTTLTIKNHEYEAIDYTWEGTTKCTVIGDCKNCDVTTQIDSTSITSQVTTPATCENMGKTTYTATYVVDWAEAQTKEVEDVAKLDHSYTGALKNDGDTHSYKCVNGCEDYGNDEPHDFTNGDCACGAEKPAPAGLKGDVNLDGTVGSADLTALARHVGGIETITNTTAFANADVNGDGAVNSADLTKHARYVGGIITDWSQE